MPVIRSRRGPQGGPGAWHRLAFTRVTCIATPQPARPSRPARRPVGVPPDRTSILRRRDRPPRAHRVDAQPVHRITGRDVSPAVTAKALSAWLTATTERRRFDFRRDGHALDPVSAAPRRMQSSRAARRVTASSDRAGCRSRRPRQVRLQGSYCTNRAASRPGRSRDPASSTTRYRRRGPRSFA